MWSSNLLCIVATALLLLSQTCIFIAAILNILVTVNAEDQLSCVQWIVHDALLVKETGEGMHGSVHLEAL